MGKEEKKKESSISEELANDYEKMLLAFEGLGVKAISRPTAAIILATVYMMNDEQFVFSRKCRTELQHIQRVYHIEGGETPDQELSKLVREHIVDCERRNDIPAGARELFKERYGLKLLDRL